MDPTTASYYRAVLYTDGLNDKPIPPGLIHMHKWAIKRHLALGLGGQMTKAFAFQVALVWLATTADGRKFATEETALGDFFCPPAEAPVEPEQAAVSQDPAPPAAEMTADLWDQLPLETKVIVRSGDQTKEGAFLGRRGAYVDVRIDGEAKPFKVRQVQLAGV